MQFPKAVVARAVDAALPEGVGATGETVEAINKCCAEFVSLIASEAKDVGEHPHIKKDHVVEAIKRLGLGSYLEGVEADVEEATKISREKKVRRRPKRTKEEEEAAAKEQRELLQASEKRFHSGEMFL